MPFNKIDRDEHQSLIDEINLLNDVKTLEDFNQIKPRIIEFFRTVKDSRYLTRLEDKIYNTDVFRSQVNINFLIELLPTVCGIAQRCIWNLMFHKLLHNKSDDEIKSQVLTALKSSVDILTKIYCYRKYRSSFTFSQWFDSFSNNSRMILHTMVIRNTQDLIEKTEEFFDSGILSLQSFYSDIVKFTIDFKNQEDKYILEKLSTYLDNLLSLWNFPKENDVVSLFKGFYDIEKDLITVLGSGYHEHLLHSFRVFLFGLQFLSIVRDYDNRLEEHQFNIDLLGWITTSFFHDLGYGVEKVHQLTSSIQKGYTGLGRVNTTSFIISESSRIIAERLMNSMEKLIVLDDPQFSFLQKEFEYLKINPILKSWDNKDHGIISAVILWQSLIDLVSKDYSFYLELHTIWNDIFMPALLAMTLHTVNPKLAYYLSFDYPRKAKEGYAPAHVLSEKPLLFSLILLLFDTVEYIERLTFSGKTFLDTAEPDIDLELEINYIYSLKNFIEINLEVIYDNITDDKLIEIADKIIPKFFGYFSYDFGINISIRNKKSEKKVIVPLLRSEFENFCIYLEKNEIHPYITEVEELNDIYQEYFVSVLTENGFKKEELYKMVEKKGLENLFPERVSFQIYCYNSTKKRFTRDFDHFKDDATFRGLLSEQYWEFSIEK